MIHSHVSFLIRTVFAFRDAASDAEDDQHGEHLNPARDYKNSEKLTFDAQNTIFARCQRYWVVKIVSRANFTTMGESHQSHCDQICDIDDKECGLHRIVTWLLALRYKASYDSPNCLQQIDDKSGDEAYEKLLSHVNSGLQISVLGYIDRMIDVFFGSAARRVAQLLVSFNVTHRQIEKVTCKDYAQ